MNLIQRARTKLAEKSLEAQINKVIAFKEETASPIYCEHEYITQINVEMYRCLTCNVPVYNHKRYLGLVYKKI